MTQDQNGGQPLGAAPEDPIVAEVRAAREAQFAAAGYDLEEYARRLRAAQARSGHPVISRAPRRAHETAP